MKERDLNIQDVLRLEPEGRRRRGQRIMEEEEEEEEGVWPLPPLEGCPSQARLGFSILQYFILIQSGALSLVQIFRNSLL